jgi:hypothetical protein
VSLRPVPLKIPAKIDSDPDLRGFFRSLVNSIFQIFSAQAEFGASDTKNITAAGGITYTKRITRVQGSGGAITVTATPSVKPISDGKEIIIQGDSDANTVTLKDESGLANSGLALAGGANVTLGKGDTLHLLYDEGDGKYYEISRSNN